MTQNITGKPKTPEEVVALYRERRPGMNITEVMARDTYGIDDEDTTTPPELIEAINAYNQTLPPEEELDDDTFDKYDTYEETEAHLSKKQTTQTSNTLTEPQTTPQPTKTTVSEAEGADIITNFRASYPFLKDVSDDEVIKRHLEKQTQIPKDSNTITAKENTVQPVTPQTINETAKTPTIGEVISNTITPQQPSVNRIDDATLTFWKNQKTKDAIYQWSCRLTTESHEEEEYLWTKEGINLRQRLLKTNGNLIGVKGLQGVGKTALKEALSNYLRENGIKIQSWKWVGKPKTDIAAKISKDTPFLDEYDESYIHELFEDIWKDGKHYTQSNSISDIAGYFRKFIGLENSVDIEDYYRFTRKNDSSTAKDNLDIWKKIIHLCPLMEKALGSTRVNLIKNRQIMEEIETTGSFILDLCDYSRLTISQMTKDLNGIQAFWENNLCTTECEGVYNQQGNLIIFFQAELFYGHHFLGKMKVIDLKPFTPDEMTSYFFSRFPLNNPFEKDAIHEIAAFSRGIMRRFKNYINIALENSIEGLMITKQNIIEWIGLDQIVKDMELELMTIFPKEKEHRVLTVKLLRFLREQGGSAKQSDVIEEIFTDVSGKASEMKASRVLGKLESYGYIERFRVPEGKMIKLK